uniref:Uncharacterized protein n=1 Tax=Rhizophora mucronata TaxID=61149 RepID=A0A2P2MZ81_RHIMU
MHNTLHFFLTINIDIKSHNSLKNVIVHVIRLVNQYFQLW